MAPRLPPVLRSAGFNQAGDTAVFSIELPDGRPAGDERWAVVGDGDPEHRAALVRHLSDRGYRVAEAADGFQAMTLIGEKAPVVAVLDRALPGCDGDRVVALASMLHPATRIILSAPATDSSRDDAVPVLDRPVDAAALDRCLAELV